MRQVKKPARRKREKCFWIDSKDGQTQFRVRGSKKPSKKVVAALQEIEAAARRMFPEKGLVIREDRRPTR